jgi:hypothetical protein
VPPVTAARQPEQDGEEQHGRLERGRDPDQYAGRAFSPGHETTQQHQQDRQDAGLAEVEGVTDRQGQHQQADRDGGGQQGGATGDGPRQGAGRDQAECGDEQQRTEGPGNAEALFGRPRQRFQYQPGEGGAGEPVAVVERSRHMQDPVLTDPRLQIGEPFARRLPQHHRHLPSRKQGDNQPEHSPGCPGPRPRRRVSAHTVLRIRHAAPTLPPFIHRPRPRTCCETFALRYEVDTINPLFA